MQPHQNKYGSKLTDTTKVWIDFSLLGCNGWNMLRDTMLLRKGISNDLHQGQSALGTGPRHAGQLYQLPVARCAYTVLFICSVTSSVKQDRSRGGLAHNRNIIYASS
jgi:hypothetical protein